MVRTNVLFTGGDGFLGTVLSQELPKENFHVQDIQDFSNRFLDITHPFALEITDFPEIVVHLAGKAHTIPKNSEEEKAFFKVNFEGTKNLCAAIDKLSEKPKAFIFISSVSVYGVEVGQRINECHPLNGITSYARSKILAEEFLAEWASDREILLTIFRLPLIAGPNPPGNLGAMVGGIKTGRYFRIGKGTSRKSIVMASDVAKIIPKAAEVGGIYNLTDGYHPSFAELEELIARQLNKPLPKSIPTSAAKMLGWAGDILGKRFPVNSDTIKKITSDLTFDDSKARKALGWTPERVLDEFKIA